MNPKVGIWIDHEKAVIVTASLEGVTVKTLESEAGPHARYSARSAYPNADGPQTATGEEKSGRGEKKYGNRYNEQLQRYYDKVIRQIGHPLALFIFGPGEAKLQLQERLGHSKVLSEHLVDVDTTDKLTDPQIVAKVKEHYGVDR